MANKNGIDELEDLIKDSIGGNVVEQTVTSLLPPGENYGSVIYKVDFKVKEDGKEEEYHAVAKCTPLNPVTQEMFNVQETFKAEIAWYTTVIPTWIQFQRDHGVEKEIDFFQPLYGSRISLDPTSDKVDLGAVLLTQNLKYLGYHNIDRHIGFDLATTYTVLRDLATFHAVPLAIRVQNRDLFDKKISPFLPKFGEMSDGVSDDVVKKVYSVIKQLVESKSIVERIVKNVEESVMFAARPVRETWATVSHMDFWMNNIMVTGGKDSKTMILDLQFPFLGSPAADLVFFLMTSVRLDIIREKFDHFVEFYYEQFTKNLKDLDVATENYPFEGLLKEIEIEAQKGEFAHSLHHSILILADKGQSDFNSFDENFKKEDFPDVNVVMNDRYREKFTWFAAEAVKRKWI